MERIIEQKNRTENFLKISISEEESEKIEQERKEFELEREREKMQIRIIDSRVPIRHKAFSEKDNAVIGWAGGLHKVREICAAGGITTILGGRGTGKTQMAVCLIKCFIRSGAACMYCKAIEISMRIRASYTTEHDTEEQAVSDYLKPYLLVVDALEERSGNEWEDRVFHHILDKRYDNMSPTVLISNETADQFKKAMGLSVISRIIETGSKVVCDWESFRGKKKGVA